VRGAGRRARIGVIGAGWWVVTHHLPLLARRDDVALVSVCRLGREELNEVRRRFGFAVASLARRHRVAALPSDLTAVELNTTTGFSTGRSAMFWPGGSPQFGQFRREASFTWDVSMLPVGRGKPSTGMGAPGYNVAQGTKHPEEAFVLLQYLTGREAQLAEVQAGTITPSRKSVAFGPEYLGQRPPERVRLIAESLDHVKMPPQLCNWTDFQATLDREMAPLWAGSKPAREAAGAAKQALAPLVQEARRMEDRSGK